MIKAMIVEDEWYNLEDVRSFAESTGFIEVCGAYQNPLEALKEFEKKRPDVAFIDIDMPEMNGLTLAEKLLEIAPALHVVFITAYNQYAVQAFDINALDYIMKPIDTERFVKTMDKLKKAMRVKEKREQVLQIKCFGDFEVRIAGMPAKWERAKAEELFAYLLINHNRKIHKGVIIEELWPEYEPSKALVILQTAACKLRNVFSSVRDIVKLEYEGSRYCLKISSCDCDLFQVESILEELSIPNGSSYQELEQVCVVIRKGLMTHQDYLWIHAREAELMRQASDEICRAIEGNIKDGKKEVAARYRKLLDTIESELEQA